MEKKKELDLEELDKISGGVWTEDAWVYLLINYDKVDAAVKNKGALKTLNEFLYTYEEDKNKSYDVEEMKNVLFISCGLTPNCLESFDPNNPEHVKILQEVRNAK